MPGPDPFVIAEEDLEEVLTKINAILETNPKAKIEWELVYYDEHGPLEKKKPDIPHEFITAKSPSLSVMVEGRDTLVVQRRTLQPLNPKVQGIVDNVLVIRHGDVRVYIYGDTIYVCDRDMEVSGIKNCISRSY